MQSGNEVGLSRSKTIGKAVLVYVLTNACNFKCSYCYESTENILSENKACFQSRFQFDTLINTYHIFSDKYGIPKSILFFGGEPLLEKELVIRFINHLKKEDATPEFTIITNASLMDENWIRFMADNFSAVTFSLDGGKVIHDKFRIDSRGEGTFQCVEEKIRKFQQINEHTKVAVEATLTKAYAEGNIHKLCEESWTLFKSLNIPIIDYIPVEGDKYSLFQTKTNQEIEAVVNCLVDLWFDDLISLQLKTDVNSFRSLLFSLIKENSARSCAAGHTYFAVTPDLSIYTCQVALFRGQSPKWRFSEDNTIVEINGGFQGEVYPKRNNRFCRECECVSGCTCYCRARWDDCIPEKIPDVCTFHRMARNRILGRISELYKRNSKELLRTAVIRYYEQKS